MINDRKGEKVMIQYSPPLPPVKRATLSFVEVRPQLTVDVGEAQRHRRSVEALSHRCDHGVIFIVRPTSPSSPLSSSTQSPRRGSTCVVMPVIPEVSSH